MAKILSTGETLKCGETRWDETGRFCLFMQPDGNLVIYAHLLEPNPRLIATGHTHTFGWGEGVDLVLSKNGRLALWKNSVGWRRALFDPEHRYYPHPSPDQPKHPDYPESSLHLQADGNLCLYYTNPPKAGVIHYSMGTLIQDLLTYKPVNPNAGILISQTLQISIPPDTANTSIENQSGMSIECFGANNQRVLIANGESVPASWQAGSIGSLSLPLGLLLPQFKDGVHVPNTGADANAGSNTFSEFKFPETSKRLVLRRDHRGDGLQLG